MGELPHLGLDAIHDNDADIADVGERRAGLNQPADLLEESIRIVMAEKVPWIKAQRTARNLLFQPFGILVTLGPGKEGVQFFRSPRILCRK